MCLNDQVDPEVLLMLSGMWRSIKKMETIQASPSATTVLMVNKVNSTALSLLLSRYKMCTL